MTAVTGLPAASVALPWHTAVRDRMLSQVEQGRLPHALLLVGPQFSGKAQLALWLARYLLCAGPEGPCNCGHCHACELSATGAHGDLRWVEPGEKSRTIKIDQVREAMDFATRTASFGSRKVIVLEPADAMNLNACNALLKSLEEPAENTYWILICHRLFTLPATIRSRCRMHRLGMPDEEACLDWLQLTTGSREQSAELLSLADGRPLLAQRYYTEGNWDDITARRHGLRALLTGRISVPEAVGLWGEEDAGSFLQSLADDLQRLCVALPLERLRTGRGRALFRLLDDIHGLQRAVGAGSNPGRQLLLETTMLKIRRELGDGFLGDNI
jgi:DNA polymerase-3 subunit delta'